MNDKKEQIKTLGTLAIILSVSVGVPSAMLLLSMLIGVGRQIQYGYSMDVLILVFLGTVPTLLGIILGTITYSKYHKNKRLYRNNKKLASFALLLPILSAILIILDLLLDTFVF